LFFDESLFFRTEKHMFVALLLLLAFAPVLAAQPDAWTDGYIFGNGIRIHYWHAANPGKPVLVLLHGSSDDGLCWTNFARDLTAGYDIYMTDARGHGFSDPPRPGDPADSQVEDLAAFLREMHLQKPILMGHSMGSSSVAWFSAKYPDIPRAVILEDPGLLPRRPQAAGGAERPSNEELIRRAVERNNRSLAELIAQCQKDSPLWGVAECTTWAPSKRRHHPFTALLSSEGRPPIRELLPRILVPTLILKADAQGELRKQNEEVAALLPKGKIVHITGAGHNVRRENKAMALGEVRTFLSALP
jgi:pimeloyl-ACP methyl ester carboxylesterase